MAVRALQGSSDVGAEQLAIPILAVVTASVPAVITLASISICPGYIVLLEMVTSFSSPPYFACNPIPAS
jgi:hypothetical protein